MYAIIRTGGKQYKVQAGDVLQVDKLEKDLGSEFDINDILMVGGNVTHVGAPTVSGAKVTVVVTKQAKTRKLFVFKKKRRQGYRKFQTHKQDFTELFIKAISGPDGEVVSSDKEPKIVDVAAERAQRIQEKVVKRSESGSKKTEMKAESEVVAPKKRLTKKKVAKKAAKKVVKKKTAKKVTTKKKVTKKTK